MYFVIVQWAMIKTKQILMLAVTNRDRQSYTLTQILASIGDTTHLFICAHKKMGKKSIFVLFMQEERETETEAHDFDCSMWVCVRACCWWYCVVELINWRIQCVYIFLFLSSAFIVAAAALVVVCPFVHLFACLVARSFVHLFLYSIQFFIIDSIAVASIDLFPMTQSTKYLYPKLEHLLLA